MRTGVYTSGALERYLKKMGLTAAAMNELPNHKYQGFRTLEGAVKKALGRPKSKLVLYLA